MKIIMMLLMFCVSAFTPAVFAQDTNTINLFGPTKVTQSPASTTTQSFTFGTKDVSLICPADGTAFARLTGADGGGLIADNFITINGQNVCPAGSNCFVRTNEPFPTIGEDVGDFYQEVGPINILPFLTAADGRYTFNLVDGVGPAPNVFGSTEINLETNCQTGYPVCHRQGGKGNNVKSKTLYVGSQNAVRAHVKHGDTASVCSAATPSL